MHNLTRAVLAGLLLTLLGSPSQAEAPYEKFLDGLVDRGYFEQALWYLDSISEDPKLPADFKSTIDYQRARVLMDSSRSILNLDERGQVLDSAAQSLLKFLKNQQKHDLAIEAQIQQGNILSEQAKLAELKAGRAKGKPEEIKSFTQQAMSKYDEARKVYEAANGKIREFLTSLKKSLDPRKDAKLIERRDKMRAAYIQTQLLASNCLLSKAKLMDEKQSGRKEALETAAKELAETYSKYRTRLAGLYARLYEGESLKLLEKKEEARMAFQDDLFTLQDSPEAFRAVKRKAAIHLSEMWDTDETAKTIKVIAPWLQSQNLRGSYAADPEWLKLKYMVAKAYRDGANKQKKGSETANNYRKEALKLAVDVSKYSGDYQSQALEIRTELQGEAAVANNTNQDLKSFQEAVDLGREKLNEAKAQKFLVTKIEQKLKSAKSKKAKSNARAELEDEQSKLTTIYVEAESAFEQSLILADREVTSDQRNTVQYYLSMLRFQSADYWRSFVRSAYVCEHYPSSSVAQQCAQLMLYSSIKLYEQADDKSNAFELSMVRRVANLIAERWPNTNEAGQAMSTLVTLQIQGVTSKATPWVDQIALLEQAEQAQARIPSELSAKADAQLKIGQTYWIHYLNGNGLKRAVEKGESQAKPPTDQQLDNSRKKAEAILSAGVENFQGDQPDGAYVLGALSLVQVYTDSDQPNKAVKLLDQPKVGLVVLAEKKHPATSRPGLSLLIYKAAVRSYISALSKADAGKTEGLMKSAENAMEQLKQLVGDDAKGQQQLVATYISLANDLKQQLDNAKPGAKKSLASAFELFLNRVTESTNEANVLNWVGDTFYKLGQSFQEAADTKGISKGYYEKAIAAFEKVLNGPSASSLSPGLNNQIQMRLAMSQRELGEYEKSIETLVKVLTESQTAMNVQMEAAKTFYDWGVAESDPKRIHAALMGSETDPTTRRNVVWGFGLIQNRLARYASQSAEESSYKDLFFEARYYLAQCRYQFGLIQTDAATKDKTLQQAKKDIAATYAFYPDMGGEMWKNKFDQLYRQIQQDLREEVTGLSAQ